MPQHPITEKLVKWYHTHKRTLPWRTTKNPYAIWVSETMLQQTQVSRVIAYYTRWMQEFPTVSTLAEASLDKVFTIWEGLGYYSRAKNLHLAAQMIEYDLNGRFPNKSSELQQLPGVGPYTSAAIASIAFFEPVVAVDANVKRLISRLHNLDYCVDTSSAFNKITRLANRYLPAKEPGEFNQAMMDLGALVCLPRSPDCPNCPLAIKCKALQAGKATERPVRKKRNKTVQVYMATGITLYQGKIFLQKRLQHDVWGGLWELPGGAIEKGETPEQAVVREYLEETGFTIQPIELLTTIKHNYTHHLITLYAFWCEFTEPPKEPVLTEAQEFAWVRPAQLKKYAFPAGHRAFFQWLSDHNLWDKLE